MGNVRILKRLYFISLQDSIHFYTITGYILLLLSRKAPYPLTVPNPLYKLFSRSDRTITAKCNGLQSIMRTAKPLRNIEEQ